jgi:NTE family protein
MAGRKKTVSLVLGSGGARGLAHIGIIRWLEEHGYRIEAISGSSMGALIGGIYAAGKLDVYTNWVTALRQADVIRLLDLSFRGAGLFSGERIIQTLRKLIGDANIEDLPISFTAVATDLDREKEVWLNRGSLFDAIRASISIPMIFVPVEYQGHMLVDGGLVNPIPIAPTVMNLTDLTIAVSLSGKQEKAFEQPHQPAEQKPAEESRFQNGISRFIDGLEEKLNLDLKLDTWQRGSDELGLYDIMTRSLEAMQNTVARFKLAAHTPDYTIDIPANACHLFEFYRASEMIELGYERAGRALANHG